MPVKRMKASDIPSPAASGAINQLPEYTRAIAELEKGLGDSSLEVTISDKSAKDASLKRPAMSMVKALERFIKAQGLGYKVMQRKVGSEPWPRVYVIGKPANGSRRSK